MEPSHFGSLSSGSHVTTPQKDSDFSLLAGIDIPAFWETLKLRWWVIPAIVAMAVGFLWAQESDLRTTPGSYYISETYEARDPTAVLASVGIDPVSVRSFPDVNNQLLLLQSVAVKTEIAEQLGSDVAVTVSRSRPSFTLVDTLESDGQSSFVFTSAGIPTYSFACNEPVKADCRSAIAAYVAKATEIRRNALAAGLADLRAVLGQINSPSADTGVETKLAAIDMLVQRLDTPMLKVSEYEESVGPLVSRVQRPTYVFGVVAGVLIALLILLQLTYSDSRIRSLRQLTRIAGVDRVLGSISTKTNPMGERRCAIGIHGTLSRSNASLVRYLPLRKKIADEIPLQRLASTTGTTAAFALPFAEQSVAGLIQPSATEVDVIVVQRNTDLRKDLIEVLAALERSSRSLAGVLLLD
jgi:hypothetical protein